MKKVFALLIVFSLVLAGCGTSASKNNADQGTSKSTNSTASTKAAPKKEAISISLGGWTSSPQEQTFVKERIQAFEKEHPNVHVNFQVISGKYNDNLQVKLSAGVAPDVFYLDANYAPKFINKGAVAPLDSYLSKQDIAAFYPSTIAGFTKDGHVYGLPKDMNTLILYYDADAFKKYNQKVPTTWAELKNTAAFFSKKSEYKAGLVLRTDFARFLPFIFQNNGQILDAKGNPVWDSKQVAQAYDFYFNQLIGSGIAKTDKDFDGNESAMTSGKVPMMISGGWSVQFMNKNAPKMNWKMAQLPAGKKKSSVIFTVAYVMNKQSKHKQEAAEFIKFMTSEKAQKMVVDSALAIPTRIAMSKYFSKKYPKYAANPSQAADSKVYSFGSYGGKISDLLTKAAEKVRFKHEDPLKALQEAKKAYLDFVSAQ